MLTAAILPGQSGTSRDGTSCPPAAAEESGRDSLRLRRNGLAVKAASRWLPTPGWTHSTPNVLTKRLDTRSWIAAFTIERICETGLAEMNGIRLRFLSKQVPAFRT